ncbi:DivIVA domain-containing protein [Leptospirillum ferrooxidans]|jgi:cell division initiation protein|uniref:Putative celldivision initiation protein n=1 Tax=Leptospirillum ferrooxidans (strain C2-3) TaxID=1162668 RepID=I0IQA6_LEPFC|nr:DivIVA domain-containing protein [Leptospirillum ferrooxidans]BAM07455.1 putative celldivision initiation protein [Leptospirillum ferrooxidans C2-3]
MIDHNRINELRHMEFAKAFRGYEPKEVDAVLAQVIAEMTELLDERRGFEERIAEFSARSGDLSGKEALLGSTLLKAEQIAESLRESARRESESMIEEARKEASRILDEARTVHARSVLEMEGTRDEWLLGLSSVRQDVQKLLTGLSQLEEKWLFLDPDRSLGTGEPETDS